MKPRGRPQPQEHWAATGAASCGRGHDPSQGNSSVSLLFLPDSCSYLLPRPYTAQPQAVITKLTTEGDCVVCRWTFTDTFLLAENFQTPQSSRTFCCLLGPCLGGSPGLILNLPERATSQACRSVTQRKIMLTFLFPKAVAVVSVGCYRDPLNLEDESTGSSGQVTVKKMLLHFPLQRLAAFFKEKAPKSIQLLLHL